MALFSLALAIGSAHAATYTVTSLNDSGAGTLREAVGLANGDGAADTIDFAVTGTITLTSGQIIINTPMTIQGPGAGLLTIDGNANSRIFLIYEAVADVCATPGVDFPVTISGLTLTNARRQSDTTVGGAIYAEKSLTLDSVVVSDSQAKSGGGLSWVTRYTNQMLTITGSRFTGNVARPVVAPSGGGHAGGGIYAFEGCSTSTGTKTITIDHGVFDGNHVQPDTLTSAAGGGLEFDGGGKYAITISASRITGNSIDPPASPPPGFNYRGGGLRVVSATSLFIKESEISDNSASRQGGLSVVNTTTSLQNEGGATQVAVSNSTVSGNVANGSADGGGGGITLIGNVAAQIRNSTITANAAAVVSNGIRLGSDFVSPATDPASYALPPSLNMVSTIISGNGTDDLSLDTTRVPTLGVNVSDSLVGVVGSGITVTGSANISTTVPGLGLLAFNGGPTRTHALLGGSAAIDNGSNPAALSTDQRGAGFLRTIGPGTDVGAYERATPLNSFVQVPALTEFAIRLLALLVGFAGLLSLRGRR